MRIRLVRAIIFLMLLSMAWTLSLVTIGSSDAAALTSGATFEETLSSFPVSYQAKLTALHASHPNWVFEPVFIDDDWAAVISKETSPENMNLVPSNSDPAWIKNYTIYDGDNWVPASKTIVEYFMDPRNFLTETAVFQFEKLTFDAATQTADGVDAIFGSNAGLKSLTPYVMEAAQTTNTSAYLLASRIKQEISESSSYGIINSARGDINLDYPPLTAGGISLCFLTPDEQLAQLLALPNPTSQQLEWIAGLQADPQVPIPAPSARYYNLYNIGALPNPSVIDGARLNAVRFAMGSQSTDPAYLSKYSLPWDSQQKSAIGGAAYIAAEYIAQGQDTMYFQKFAVAGNVANRYWHQYMQNLQAACNEGSRYYNGYNQAGALGNAFTFRIPVYRGMPAQAVSQPTLVKSATQTNALAGFTGQTVKIISEAGYRIRPQPNTVQPSVGTASAGSSYIIQGAVTGEFIYTYGNQWYQISYNGQKAYIIADLNGQIIPAKVTWNSQGGSAISPSTVNLYSKLTAPAKPIRSGYTFVGWFKDSACTKSWNFSTNIVSASLTLYARWQKIPVLSAKSAGYSSISLSWAAIPGTTGYQVYRATSSTGPFTLLKTTRLTALTDTSLSTGKTYYYKIRSYTTVNSANLFSSLSGAIAAKTVPAVPANFTAKSASYNSVKLAWNTVSGATGYQIFRATSSTGTYSLIKTTIAASYLNTGLSTGKTYYYRVRAYRTVGTTPVYSAFTAIKSAKPVPAVPGSFEAYRYNSTSIKTKWLAVSGASGYEIYRATASTGLYSRIKTTTATYCVNTGLSTGKIYYYKVRAYRLVGSTKIYGSFTAVKSARP